MTGSRLHDNLLVIDGLVASRACREVFEDMRRGGVTAANWTCCYWENFRRTMENVAAWKRVFRDHTDLLRPVRAAADIGRAKAEGRLGIILGWQNTTGIDDQLGFLQLFKELGVGIIQLTYNTQNTVGSGCYESRDGGLSDFGRQVVEEMNGCRIVVDLSHVGPRTSEDAIRASRQPVCYSHTCPRALRDHPRNRSDDELRLLADRGGFVGITAYPSFLPRGTDSTVEDLVDAVIYALNLIGEDQVGISTDFNQGQDRAFLEWAFRDKGYARPLAAADVLTRPAGFRAFGDFPNLTAAMQRRGWPERRIRKVMGENWLAFLREVWGA